jgi:hypothetical protein
MYHFLHIRKTGGNAIREALAAVANVVLHRHSVTLDQIPEGGKAFFALRDPVDRFVSGFNSRKRCGRPKLNSRWNGDERTAFERFATPNALAIAISSSDQEEMVAAHAGMSSIRHVNSKYADWLCDVEYLERRRGDIIWVGRTGRLSEDFEELKRCLSLPISCQLPADPVLAHRRLPTDSVSLSPEARENIQRWYASDYAFLRHLCP